MLGSSISPKGLTERGRRHAPPALALIEEADAINEATSNTPLLYMSLLFAAWRGQESRTLELVAASAEDATTENETGAVSLAEYVKAVLYNGLGRYRAALAAAEQTCRYEDAGLVPIALSELVEAGARGNNFDASAAALRGLEERTPAAGSDRALGIQARSRALLSDGEDAEALYRQALELLATGHSTLHLARAQLVYGEWLRRRGRRVDAREQLRATYETFSRIGAGGFAERARRELLATGETVRKRSVETRDDLTPQEAEIARLAGRGYTNPEIGARLFISPRTVEWHLHKVFMKLAIRSRRELRGARPKAGRATITA
jgi:DNA-binding CsgD family transcriptional regulator